MILSMVLVNVTFNLAYYLSSSISNLNLSSTLDITEEKKSRYMSPNIYKQRKDVLDQLEPRLAAKLIFGDYNKQKKIISYYRFL
jgi:hypothetical protein